MENANALKRCQSCVEGSGEGSGHTDMELKMNDHNASMEEGLRPILIPGREQELPHHRARG